MIYLKHITVEACETCGAAPRLELVDDAADGEQRHFACGRKIAWHPPGVPWEERCPKHPDEIRKRENRIRAIKTLLSTLTKLELPVDDAANLAERIKSTWFEIKDSDLR